ncbi:MAG: hypothetical protein ACJ0G4_04975 [Alphaproteobacteria bacterium]
MKKNKYDLFLTLKKLKRNKLLNNLSTLNNEKEKLNFIQETLKELIITNEKSDFEQLTGSDLKRKSQLRQSLMNKIQISNNRENYLSDEINNNILEISKIEQQKKKIKEKKIKENIKKENFEELKKENNFNYKNHSAF